MIYLLSDPHQGGEGSTQALKEYLANAKDEDLLILLGDICLRLEEEYREFDEFFLSSTKNIAFIDGNHENLKKRGNQVDYILTHKYETGRGTQTPKLRELAEYIDQNVDFKMWYAGHWHTDEQIDEKHRLVFAVPTPVE